MPSDAGRTGDYTFDYRSTSGGPTGGDGGLDWASFLLGDVTQVSRYVSTSLDAAERQHRMFYYGQDTWRVTPKLTLNYGLRWEVYFPEYVNGKDKGGFANLVQGLDRVAGEGGIGLNGNINNAWDAFAPRFGVAYQVNPKTVVRLGYGRSFDMGVFGSNFGHTVTQTLPVLAAQLAQGASQEVPAFTLQQGPPIFTFPAIPGNGLLPVSGPNCYQKPMFNAAGRTLSFAYSPISVRRPSASPRSMRGTQLFSGRLPPPLLSRWPMSATKALTYSLAMGQRTTLTIPQSTDIAPTRAAPPLRHRYTVDPTTTYLPTPATPTRRTRWRIFPVHRGLFRAYCSAAPPTRTTTWATMPAANTMPSRLRSKSASPMACSSFRTTRSPTLTNTTTITIRTTQHSLRAGRSGPKPRLGKQFGIRAALRQGRMFAGNSGRAEDLVIGGWQITGTTTWGSGLPWTPSTNECGGEEDVGVCRPGKGSGSFHTGARAATSSGGTPFVQFFTPLPTLTGPFTDPGRVILATSVFSVIADREYFSPMPPF